MIKNEDNLQIGPNKVPMFASKLRQERGCIRYRPRHRRAYRFFKRAQSHIKPQGLGLRSARPSGTFEFARFKETIRFAGAAEKGLISSIVSYIYRCFYTYIIFFEFWNFLILICFKFSKHYFKAAIKRAGSGTSPTKNTHMLKRARRGFPLTSAYLNDPL